MIPSVKNDYIAEFTTDFELEPSSTALILVDMQYATACRKAGLGKLLERQGKGDLGKYRFDRIESTVVPTIQSMLSFFREHELAVVYITMGSHAQDFSDTLPYLRNFFRSTNNRIGSKEHEILEELKPEPDELVINKTTIINVGCIGKCMRQLRIGYYAYAKNNHKK